MTSGNLNGLQGLCTAMDVRKVTRTLDAHERNAHTLRTTHSLDGTRTPIPTAAQAAVACVGDCIDKAFPDADARVGPSRRPEANRTGGAPSRAPITALTDRESAWLGWV